MHFILLATFFLYTQGTVDLEKLDDEDYWNTLDLDPYDIDSFDETDGLDLEDDDEVDIPETNQQVQATVKNPSQYDIDVFFRTDLTSPIVYFFSLKPGGSQPINTFPGHTLFVAMGGTKTVVETFKMNSDKSEYIIPGTIDEFDGEEMDSLPDAPNSESNKEKPAGRDLQISLSIRNSYEFPIDIWWKGDGQDQYIYSVQPGDSNNINTFVGHVFLAKKLNSEELVQKLTVESQDEDLVFGLDDFFDDDDELLDLGYGEDDYIDPDDEDEDLEEMEKNDELDLDELGEGSAESCSAEEETCEAGASPTHTKMEPLLSKWNKKQVNPYKGMKGFAAKFRNLQNEQVSLSLGKSEFVLRAGGSTTRYVSHGDKVTWRSKSGSELKVSTMHRDQSFYVLGSGKDNLDWGSVHKKDMAFARKYYQEHGQVWLVSSNAEETKGFLWYASQVGQKHRVTVKGKYTCENGDVESTCFASSSRLKLITMSLSPRVFEIKEFLSSQEVEFLRSLEKSIIKRSDSPVIEQLYGRAADLMRRPTLSAGDLQFTRYKAGEGLSPQLGFDVEDCTNLQFATLFIFLSQPSQGGELVFDEVTLGPTTYNAVLMQSKLPDGNVDPRSIYSINKVIEGEFELLTLNLWDGSKVGCDTRDASSEFI